MNSPVDSLIILVNKIQMIKNSIYSYEYSQPKDYRFSLDSVFLAQKVAEFLKNDSLNEIKVLDLCAGCGVIGLELNYHLPKLLEIDFLEVQSVYLSHFEQNKIQAKNHEKFRFLEMNYNELQTPQFENRYDYIVSNPPYFFPGEGLYSPNEFKNRCRFFIDSDFVSMVKSIVYSLKPQGSAFILMRPGGHHGRDLVFELKELSRNMADIEIFDEVRGTFIIRLIKKS